MNGPMRAPQVKGWCPGALQPMPSGDGLVVRVRPRAGALSAMQARAVAQAALSCGNGLIDITSRANLQIRGVTEASHPSVVATLDGAGLLDADAARESRRNVIVTPFHAPGDGTPTFAARLEAALAHGPGLPGKFGFAIDTAELRHLSAASADIRLERAADGGLLVRADGLARGKLVGEEDAVAEMMALARWFIDTGGEAAGRMAAHVAKGHAPPDAAHLPVQAAAAANPGPRPQGFLVGVAFGQIEAAVLQAIADLGTLRVTPWRMLLIEGLRDAPELPGLITRTGDPLQFVTACIGRPGCLQARGETRNLARLIAPLVPRGSHVHVSGCGKGCAHPGSAPVTLVAGARGFDLVIAGNAMAAPVRRGLSAEWLVGNLGAVMGSP